MAAVSGVVVGQMLGHSAWPLAIAVALMGGASLLLWFATIPVRARVQHH
jgi:hypothetical protein